VHIASIQFELAAVNLA